MGLIWYNGSKGVVIIISKLMVVELGLDKICVNCVNLVILVIGLLFEFMGVFDILENCKKFVVIIFMGCFFILEDIVNVCLYLGLDEV